MRSMGTCPPGPHLPRGMPLLTGACRIGGGGQLDSSINAKSNTAVYTSFAVFGFTAGSFLNYCECSCRVCAAGADAA